MAMPRKADPMRHCAHCGVALERKRFGTRLEDRATFLRRKYCNRTCMAQAFIQEDATLAALRKRAEQFRGLICQECGTADRLQIHHMDSNPANNAPENLRTLCSTCHMRWHWTHGKPPWKAQGICKVCGEPSRKLGMCQKHYQRFRKYGDPLLTKKRTGSRYELLRETPGAPNGPASRE